MNDEPTSEAQVREGSRIAKVMARAGLCSRRDAEVWIAEGRVTVNGEVLTSPAYNVSDVDDVRIDGQPLAARERTRLFMFHKPRGLVTTARDPEGRATIFGALPPDLPRVVAIGRLDINTEGLLLLTNDGGLARVFELPSTGWLRRYRVRAHGSITQSALDGLSGGVTIDGVHYAGIDAKLDREQGSNAWITMGLREGKNREIKKVLEHLGLSVNRLIRVSFGPFELGDLAEGEVMEVRTRVLRDQLGAKLAREAGVDFESPVVDHAPPPPSEPPRRERDERRAPPPRGRAPDRKARRGDTFGKGRDEAPPSRPLPPPPSMPERRRKHVSALRAQIATDAAEQDGPRKRVARSATQDRKGRTITVERRSRKNADDDAPILNAGQPMRGARSPARPGRDAPERALRPGSFDAQVSRDGKGRGGVGRRPSGEGRDFVRPGRAPGAAYKPRGDDRPRPPRSEGRDVGEGRDFRRPARAPGDAFKPRGEGATRFLPREKRGSASAPLPGRYGRSNDERSGRERSGSDGVARSGRERDRGGEGRPKRPFGEGRDAGRPPRAGRGAGEGFKPRGERAGSDRPGREGPPRSKPPRSGAVPGGCSGERPPGRGPGKPGGGPRRPPRKS
jgi:23S rRNA pseudouridine2605 synthase